MLLTGRFNKNSSDYDGSFGETDGVKWLENKCFAFNIAPEPPSFGDVSYSYDVMYNIKDTIAITISDSAFPGSEIQYSVNSEFCGAMDIIEEGTNPKTVYLILTGDSVCTGNISITAHTDSGAYITRNIVINVGDSLYFDPLGLPLKSSYTTTIDQSLSITFRVISLINHDSISFNYSGYYFPWGKFKKTVTGTGNINTVTLVWDNLSYMDINNYTTGVIEAVSKYGKKVSKTLQVIIKDSPPTVRFLDAEGGKFVVQPGNSIYFNYVAQDKNPTDILTVTYPIDNEQLRNIQGKFEIKNNSGWKVEGKVMFSLADTIKPGNYPVCIEVTDKIGNKGRACLEIVVPYTPDMLFSYEATCNNNEVLFKTIEGGTYTWDFGDGSPKANVTVGKYKHTYPSPGHYQVVLQMIMKRFLYRDLKLEKDFFDEVMYMGSKDIQVGMRNAFFTVKDVCLGELASFDNVTEDGQTYLWNFGDGTTSGEKTPVHLYSKPTSDKPYTVKLSMQKDECKSDYSANINVYLSPKAVIEGTKSTCAGTKIHFDGSKSQNALRYLWSFADTLSDGSIATSRRTSPDYTFEKPGSFEVSLVVQNGVCKSEDKWRVQVDASPVALIVSPDGNVICDGSSLTLKAKLENVSPAGTGI